MPDLPKLQRIPSNVQLNQLLTWAAQLGLLLPEQIKRLEACSVVSRISWRYADRKPDIKTSAIQPHCRKASSGTELSPLSKWT